MSRAAQLQKLLPHLPLQRLDDLEAQTAALIRAEPLRRLRGASVLSAWTALGARFDLQEDLQRELSGFDLQTDVMASLLTGGLHGALLMNHPEWGPALASQSAALIQTLADGWSDSGTSVASFRLREVLTLPLAPALMMAGLDSASWTEHIGPGLSVLALSSALVVACGEPLPVMWAETMQVASQLSSASPALSWEVLLAFAGHLGARAPQAVRTWTRSPLALPADAWSQVMTRPLSASPMIRTPRADAAALRRACWPPLQESEIPSVIRRTQLVAHDTPLAGDYRLPWEVPTPLWNDASNAPWAERMLESAAELLSLGEHLTRHASSWSRLCSLLQGRQTPEQLVMGLLLALPEDHRGLPFDVQRLAQDHTVMEHQVFLWRTHPQVHEALWLAAHLLRPDHTGAWPASLPMANQAHICSAEHARLRPTPEHLLAHLNWNLRHLQRELNQWGIDPTAPRQQLNRR